VQKLNAATNAALVSPEVSARFAELNVESHQNTPDEFRAYVEDQMALWSRVVKEGPTSSWGSGCAEFHLQTLHWRGRAQSAEEITE